jgi:hypothetical protein
MGSLTEALNMLLTFALPIVAAYYITVLIAAWRARFHPLEQIFFGIGAIVALYGAGLIITHDFWETLNGLKLVVIGGSIVKLPKLWTMTTGREFLSRRRHPRLVPEEKRPP